MTNASRIILEWIQAVEREEWTRAKEIRKEYSKFRHGHWQECDEFKRHLQEIANSILTKPTA